MHGFQAQGSPTKPKNKTFESNENPQAGHILEFASEGQKLSLLNQLDIPYSSYGVDELCYLRKDAKIFDTSLKYWAHLF
jgi:hypothetical protein